MGMVAGQAADWNAYIRGTYGLPIGEPRLSGWLRP